MKFIVNIVFLFAFFLFVESRLEASRNGKTLPKVNIDRLSSQRSIFKKLKASIKKRKEMLLSSLHHVYQDSDEEYMHSLDILNRALDNVLHTNTELFSEEDFDNVRFKRLPREAIMEISDDDKVYASDEVFADEDEEYADDDIDDDEDEYSSVSLSPFIFPPFLSIPFSPSKLYLQADDDVRIRVAPAYDDDEGFHARL